MGADTVLVSTMTCVIQPQKHMKTWGHWTEVAPLRPPCLAPYPGSPRHLRSSGSEPCQIVALQFKVHQGQPMGDTECRLRVGSSSGSPRAGTKLRSGL